MYRPVLVGFNFYLFKSPMILMASSKVRIPNSLFNIWFLILNNYFTLRVLSSARVKSKVNQSSTSFPS